MADPSKYSETFRLIDTNRDGLISAVELKQLMTAVGEEVTDEAVEEAVQLMDTDGDKLISLEEFAEYLSTRTS